LFSLRNGLCFAEPSGAGPHWADGFFVEGSVQYNHLPELFKEYLEPEIGFRAGLGYEWGPLQVSVGSGRTSTRGVMPTYEGLALPRPIVEEIELIPLTLNISYTFNPVGNFNIRPEIGGGIMFIHVDHYQTMLNLLETRERVADALDLMAEAKLFLEWDILKPLTVYAGGGVELVLEKAGPIPLVSIEAGLRVKPVALTRYIVNHLPVKKRIPAALPVKKVKKPVEKPRPVVVPEPEPEPVPPSFNGQVRFAPNSTEFLGDSLAALDAAGKMLAEHPTETITITAYAAPFQRPDLQWGLSRERAEICAAWLEEHYGIESARIRIAYFGATRMPAAAIPEQYETYRAAELKIGRQEAADAPVIKTAYFAANTAELLPESGGALEQIGERLAAEPDALLELRAYAAQFNTPGQQYGTARERAEFCAAWLEEHYGISRDRLRNVVYGGEQAPRGARVDQPATYRAVEMEIITEHKKEGYEYE
jgi:outer membrane protein OmpA-like peptidoglycan-associated protein